MLRIRNLVDPDFPYQSEMPYYPPFYADDGHIRGLYDPEWNEIVLVRFNIPSKKALVSTFCHEFLHCLIYQLHLPRKLNRFIDRIDLKLQILNGRRIDKAWGLPRYKKPKKPKYSTKNTE